MYICKIDILNLYMVMVSEVQRKCNTETLLVLDIDPQPFSSSKGYSISVETCL